MAKTLQKLLMSLCVILQKSLEDIFIIGGVGIIVATTYQISYIAGNYSLGVVVIMLGLILAKRG